MGCCTLATLCYGVEFPDRYWPEFPVPTEILLSETHTRLSFSESILQQSLAGLVAHQTKKTGTGQMVWIGVDNPNYREWLSRCISHNRISLSEHEYTVWELVDKYVSVGLIQGYILCRQDSSERALYEESPVDWSVNVATALCPILNAVVIEEQIENKAQQHGLRKLLDVRGRDEAWLWQEYKGSFFRGLLGRQDPKNPVMRYEIVAFCAPLASEVNPLYEEVLKHTFPGSPVLGWGIGLEDRQTMPSSRQGLFQTATNWCINLPILSSGSTGLKYPFEPFQNQSDIPALKNDEKLISFVLSDGDNVQWLMLNFCQGDEGKFYWGDPYRGKLPFGWTIPAVDLLQLCPYTLDFLRDSQIAADDFILYGGGYFYPDLFGVDRNRMKCLEGHARRIRKYMKHCGLKLILFNSMDWDSSSALEAYEVYANEIPELEGILTVQYAPYAAGGGQIRWVGTRRKNPIPVVSAKYAIWGDRGNDPLENSPSAIAKSISHWAETAARSAEDRFAWVIVHAWSWFRDPTFARDQALSESVPPDLITKDDSSIARGYRPAYWCAQMMADSVRVVKPIELIQALKSEKFLESNSDSK